MNWKERHQDERRADETLTENHAGIWMPEAPGARTARPTRGPVFLASCQGFTVAFCELCEILFVRLVEPEFDGHEIPEPECPLTWLRSTASDP